MQLPRRIGRAGDCPELRTVTEGHVRNVPDWRVRQIERLESELELLAFSDRKQLEQRKIKVLEAVGPQRISP